MFSGEKVSRRDFLKLAGASFLAMAAGRLKIPETEGGMEIPDEVMKWGMVGPEKEITQDEIDTEIKPNLVKLIDKAPAAVNSEYVLIHGVALDGMLDLLVEMFKLGIRCRVNCGFRDLDWQTQAYESSKVNGVASGYVSPPGRSQHHTGLAVDFQSLDKRPFKGNGFEDTKEGIWLDTHAHLFGFVRSFLGGENEKLFTPEESWHFMFVGIDLAKEHFRRRLTNPSLEFYEFLREMLEIKDEFKPGHDEDGGGHEEMIPV